MAITVAYQQASTYTGAQDRVTLVAGMTHITNIVARSGVVPAAGNPLLVSAAGGMALTVSPGHAMVENYTFTVDSNINTTVATSGATARTDAVILRVYEQDSGDTAPSRGVVEMVTGSSIALPSIPARSFVLAYVTVGASVSSVNSGNLTDARVYTAAAGGVIPIAGSYSTFPSAGLAAGTPVWDASTKRLMFVKSGGFDEPTSSDGVIKTCTATGTTTASTTAAITPDIAGWAGQTFTITRSRWLRCTAGIAVQASLPDTKVAVSVDIASAGRLRWGDVVPVSGTTLEPSPSGRMFSLSAGTYTISATLSKAATATAATANIAAGATLQIEDCGPA